MVTASSSALVGAGAVGSALVGGVFFTFSTFVASALRRLPPAEGLPAMQAMNRAAPSSPLFMLALGGTAVVSAVVAVSAIQRLDGPAARWELAASALYLGGMALTVVYHVPQNEALVRVDPAGVGAVKAWTDYLPAWVAWNHVRTVSALASSVAFVLALRTRA